MGDLGSTTRHSRSTLPLLNCAVPKSHGKSNMEVIVGTYEQVLVGFDVLFGEDELEVVYELVKCNLNFSLLIV